MNCNFKELTFPPTFEYASDSQHLPIEFYLKVMPLSKVIYLKLGYFSSSALRLLSCSFAQFIYNGGQLNVITNHFMYGEDKDLISDSLSEIEEFNLHDLEKVKKSLSVNSKHFFNCLKYLISKNRLNIIPVMLKPARMTHFKQGIFTDKDGNNIFMDGSCNFTANGLLENAETLSVFRLWASDFEKNKGYGKKEEMDSILHHKNEKYRYLSKEELLDAVQSIGEEKSLEELLTDEYKIISLESNNFQKISKQLNVEAIKLEELIKKEKERPKFPFQSGPREYQIEAYDSWKKNNYLGIFLMATGTGKTITSINCLLELYKAEKLYQSVILVPGTSLLKQWIEEVKSFNFNLITPCSSEFPKWDDNIKLLLSNLRFNKNKSFIIIATYNTFVSDRFQNHFKKLPENALLIADEAHNLGSKSIKKILPNIHLRRRIALTATIHRQYDEEGNIEIEKAFNSRPPYTYNFSMGKAIEKGALCQYVYYPHFVKLSDDENTKYVEISKELMKHFDFEKNRFKESEYVQKLLIKRKRIIHKCQNKLQVFVDIIKKHHIEKNSIDYSFVYVPEGDFETTEQENKNILDEFIKIYEETFPNKRPYAFTGETKDRDTTINLFEQGYISTLFSMKCLDEGVDVPRTELAIFCSSSGNPRQFIQRRGRVLRKHEEKSYAVIHDMVVIPAISIDSDTFKFERKIVKDEILRVVYFASLARNYSEIMRSFEEICEKYHIDLYGLQEQIEGFQ